MVCLQSTFSVSHRGGKKPLPFPLSVRFSFPSVATVSHTEEMAAPTRAQGRHARSLDGGLSDLLPGTVQSGRTLPLPPNGRKLEK